MLKNRLPYRFLLVFLIFSFVLIMPYFFYVYLDADMMRSKLDDIQALTVEQALLLEAYTEAMIDNIVAYIFYLFVMSFILAVFFSKKLLRPVRELYRGILGLKEGDYAVRIDVLMDDEIKEVSEAFNDMIDNIQKSMVDMMRNKQYVNTMMTPIWIVDEDNIVQDMNPAFTKLFGYARSEVVGFSIYDFLDDDAERIMRKMIFEKREDAYVSYELSIISKQEGYIPVLIGVSPIIEDGEPGGSVGVITDLRGQVDLRNALKEEKDKADAVMDSIVDNLLVIDMDYRVVKANLAARVNIGRNFDGEGCHHVLYGFNEKCFLRDEDCPVRVVFETGKSHKVIRKVGGPGGAKTYYEVIAYPVHDNSGAVKFAVETMRDVTERMRYEDEIALKNRELTMMNSISRMLSQSLRAEDIFSNVLEKVIGLMGMDGGGIFFLDESGRDLHCRFHRGLSDEFMKGIGRLRSGEDLPGKVALSGQMLTTTDISTDPRGGKSAFKHSGLKGFACIPIRGKEKLIGVFFIFSFGYHNFTDDEERLLNSISEMMGISFENIRLYEKMRQMYEHNRIRRAEEQKDLLSLSAMLAATLDMKRALYSSLDLVKDSAIADYAWLLELNAEGALVLKSSSEEQEEGGRTIYGPGVDCIEHRTLTENKPVMYSDIITDPALVLDEAISRHANAYCLPMYVGDKALGTMTLYFQSGSIPTEEELNFLQTIASLLAVALERARLYENIILQQGMSETILKSITDAVMTVDASGTIILLNNAAEQIMNFKTADAEGMQYLDIISERGEDNIQCRMKLEEGFEGALKGDISSAEMHLISPEGARTPVIVRSAPMRDDLGNIIGVVYVIRDISTELELDSMKMDFVRSVSHEFRTPLTAIVGMTEMVLEEEIGPERSAEYLQTILFEGRRLTEMVTNVLDIARIEAGKEIFRESRIDFRRLLAYLRDTFDTLIEKKEIKYSSSLDDDIIDYVGDEEKLKQMLRLLIDNSMTYSNKGCKIKVEIKRKDDNVAITVSDTGWGMDDAELLHAGEKFFRGKKASAVKGTGLGLSLCQSIVKMHGGSLLLRKRSGRGKGTVVDVQLPMRRT